MKKRIAASSKICNSCKTNLNSLGSRKCLECNRAYQKQSYKLRRSAFERSKQLGLDRQNFINAIKNLPCQDCGVKFPTECMDFDHRDPELKSFTITARYVSESTESRRRLMLEVSKCDLVCANCHRIRTKKFGHSAFRKSKSAENPEIVE